MYIYKTRPSTSIEFHIEPNFFVVHARPHNKKNSQAIHGYDPDHKRIYLFYVWFFTLLHKNTYRPIVFSATMTIVSLTFKRNFIKRKFWWYKWRIDKNECVVSERWTRRLLRKYGDLTLAFIGLMYNQKYNNNSICERRDHTAVYVSNWWVCRRKLARIQ